MKKTIIAVLLIAICCCSSSGPNPRRAHVLRIKDRQVIAFLHMIRQLRDTDVILVGESHDSTADHSTQLAVIKSLEVTKVPIAVGLEMFKSSSQRALDRWVEGTIPLKSFVKIYYENWTEPWPLYRDIFLYARRHRIPMIGLNLPENISDKVFKSGFGSLSEAEKKEIPPGIQCTVDRKYRAFISDMYGMHHTGGEKGFSNFCEAQMLWDSVMAWNVIHWLNNRPDMKVVVLAGIGHAWKRGIPDQIKARSKYSFAVVLPELPTGKQDRDITVNDADYLLIDQN
jgi:uncharacterized iron-regulated protein